MNSKIQAEMGLVIRACQGFRASARDRDDVWEEIKEFVAALDALGALDEAEANPNKLATQITLYYPPENSDVAREILEIVYEYRKRKVLTFRGEHFNEKETAELRAEFNRRDDV